MCKNRYHETMKCGDSRFGCGSLWRNYKRFLKRFDAKVDIIRIMLYHLRIYARTMCWYLCVQFVLLVVSLRPTNYSHIMFCWKMISVQVHVEAPSAIIREFYFNFHYFSFCYAGNVSEHRLSILFSLLFFFLGGFNRRSLWYRSISRDQDPGRR